MIELRTLGSTRMYLDGEPVNISRRKPIALAVYLACHQGERFTRDHIAQLLWERATRARARHSLSQALYYLRHTAPELRIGRNGTHVWLDDHVVKLDLQLLQLAVAAGELEKALRYYRGEFLEGFWLDDAPRFEHWQERLRLETRRLAGRTARRLLEAAANSGEWSIVERNAHTASHLNPLDASVHTSIIQAAIAQGDIQGAQATYDDLAVRMRDQLGTEPSAALEALIVRASESVGRDSITRVPAGLSSSQVQMPFVGRGREFQIATNEWGTLTTGGAALLTVVGEAGIGKTRFCTHFLQWAELQNARILSGRCHSSEVRLPYSAAVDALTQSITEHDFRMLAPAWQAVVAQLLPELMPQDTHEVPSIELSAEGARRRLFEGIARLLSVVCRSSSVIFFIDDFHWADESTSQLMLYLCRKLRDHRMLFLIAMREEDLPSTSSARLLLRHHALSIRHREIRLAGFDTATAGRFVKTFVEEHNILVDSNLEQQIVRQSGGRPFFLIEMLRAVQRREFGPEQLDTVAHLTSAPILLPRPVQDFLSERFSELNDLELNIVRSLAVIGRESEPKFLRRICELTVQQFLEGVQRLSKKGFLDDRGDSIAFSHDLIREAAYRSIGGLHRRTLHDRVVNLLSETDDPPPGTLAVHADLAGDSRAAHTHALEAADAAESVYAYDEVHYYLRMALANAEEEVQQRSVQERLAILLFRLRRFPEADEIFAALQTQSDATVSPDQKLLLDCYRASISTRQGTVPANLLLEDLNKLAKRAQELDDDGKTADALCLLARVGHEAGQRSVVTGAVTELTELAERTNSSSYSVQCYWMAANMCGLYLDVRQAVKLAEKALESAQRSTDPSTRIAGHAALAMNLLQSGDLKQSEDNFMKAFQLAEEHAIVEHEHSLHVNYGVCLIERGRFDDASRIYRRAEELAEDAGAIHELAVVYENRAVLALERNDFKEARAWAERILQSDNATAAWWHSIVGWTIIGYYALERRNFTDAHRCKREIDMRFQKRDFWVSDFSYTEIFLARLAELEGETDKALDRLAAAIAAYEHRDVFCRSRLEIERARLLAGQDPESARAAAEEVRARAARMGARPLVDKADRVLDRIRFRSAPA